MFRETIEKQSSDIKNKQKDILDKSEKVEHLQAELDILKRKAEESKKRSKKNQSQVRTLYQERADFLAKLQDQSRVIGSLRKQLGIIEKENEELEQQDSSSLPRFTIAELKELLNERNDLKNRVNELEEQLMAYKLATTPSDLQETAKDFVKDQSAADDDAPVQGT